MWVFICLHCCFFMNGIMSSVLAYLLINNIYIWYRYYLIPLYDYDHRNFERAVQQIRDVKKECKMFVEHNQYYDTTCYKV